MGYLTTVTIYNDSADQLEKYPKQLAEALSEACMGTQRSLGRDYAGLGNAANILILQKPRHADDHTLYLHAGNSVYCVEDVEKESEWLLNQFISEMEYHVKRLKKIRDNKSEQ